MVKFYKKWKKDNEIQLTKSKMDLNNRKMTNHPPSPVTQYMSSVNINYPTSSQYIKVEHRELNCCQLNKRNNI